MAKQPNISGKVRFVMLEAEIVDGNLSEIAQAIAGAIAPAPVIQRVVQPAPALSESSNGRNSKQQEPPNLFSAEDSQEEDLPTVGPKVGKPPKNRKYPVPKVVDLDLDSGDAPWEEFAKQKNPADTTKKFLTVAFWLKEYRGITSITADHVYTCFKRAEWSTGMKDFGQPFRQCKSQGWMNSSEPGQFEINHVGESVVKKMGTGQ